MGLLPLSKPEPRRRVKARRRREERRVIQRVRDDVSRRDGYCRFAHCGLGACGGPSEWAHYGERKRSKTMRMDPEHRHATTHSLMLCKAHHDAYDKGVGGRLEIEPLTDLVCDGQLRASRNGGIYEEAA